MQAKDEIEKAVLRQQRNIAMDGVVNAETRAQIMAAEIAATRQSLELAFGLIQGKEDLVGAAAAIPGYQDWLDRRPPPG